MVVWPFVLSALLALPCVLAKNLSFSLMPLEALARGEQLCLTRTKNAFTNYSVEARPCAISESQLWISKHHLARHIVSLTDGTCLDFDATSKRVFTHECNGKDSQDWYYYEIGLEIRAQYVDLCLRFHDQISGGITAEVCDGMLSQKFLRRWIPAEVRMAGLETLQLTCPYVYNAIMLAVFVTAGACICLYMICCWMDRKQLKADPNNFLGQPLNPVNTIIDQKLDWIRDVLVHVSSKLTDDVATPDTDDHSSSAGTVGSWTHVAEEPCCFLPDTFLKKVTDVGTEFVSVQNLFQGVQVAAADGSVIEVLQPPEQHQVDSVIKLQAGPSCLVVSPDHRILVPGNKTVQARDLSKDSYVVLDGTAAKLTFFEWRREPTMVVKISFIPDLPVAGFLPQPAIWSKGSRQKAPVRRGIRKPRQGGDWHTMPDTEPPLTP